MKKPIICVTSLLFMPLAMATSTQNNPIHRGAADAQSAAQLEFDADRYCEARFTSVQQDALKNCETQYITQKCADSAQPAHTTGMCAYYLGLKSGEINAGAGNH
jgi:hypothetical protein